MSVRGDGPSELIEVDLDAAELVRRVVVEGAAVVEAPPTKGGTAGLGWLGDDLVVATWGSVAVVDPVGGATREVWTDRRFSDLHGLSVEADGRILVTSTNLDAVFAIDGGAVTPVWYAAHGEEIERSYTDFRRVEKDDHHYHHLHVNDVASTPDGLVVTYLGVDGRRPVLARAATRLLGPARRRDRLLGRRFRHGGMVVGAGSGTARHLRGEGLHDAVVDDRGAVWSTEYFGAAVTTLRSGRLVRTDLRPHPGPAYLTRGIVFRGDHLWVGHTLVRSAFAGGTGIARLREYRVDGVWTGREVLLPDCIGAYALLAPR